MEIGAPPPSDAMVIETICPSSAPVVVPDMDAEEASPAWRKPSVQSSMATEMVGGVVS